MDFSHNLMTPLASHGPGWHAGGWVWWGPIIPLLWIVFFATAFWFVTRRLRPQERSGVDRARDILAERFARGEVTSDEYRERLEQLGGGR